MGYEDSNERQNNRHESHVDVHTAFNLNFMFSTNVFVFPFYAPLNGDFSVQNLQ